MATNDDLQHLQLLSIFHYIVAGLAALFSLIPIVHFGLGIAMVTGRIDGSEPPPPFVGWFLIVIAAGIILLGMSFAVCIALTGRFLAQRAHYVFCFVMAAIECIFTPFGTVLGVFTILVLARPSVKELFGRPAAAGVV